MISVRRPVFLELHHRFDRGETNVCSGKKDGTNRPLMRRDDGVIIAVEDGREVGDFETSMAIQEKILGARCFPSGSGSRYGQVMVNALRNGRDAQLYQVPGGAICDGVFFSRAELMESTT